MLNGGLWRVRFSVTRKLLILEREIGFEPATSSLGSYPNIESKSLARFCCELLNLQHLAKSAFSDSVRLNEAQTRQVLLLSDRAIPKIALTKTRWLKVHATNPPRRPACIGVITKNRNSGGSRRLGSPARTQQNYDANYQV